MTCCGWNKRCGGGNMAAFMGVMTALWVPMASSHHKHAQPATMKAVQVTAFGAPDVMKVATIPCPKPEAGEALVRVRAAGVNPVDWKIREGKFRGMGPTPPYVPGYDVAGVIESIQPLIGADADAKTLKVGDEVYAYLPVNRGGGYAEYVAVPLKDLAKKPAKADFEHAAATPLAGLTAWQALFDQGALKPGQTVLIHGAAGGVGHFAVQLAKWKGATVIATASKSNHEFLTKLGADVCIDYTTEKFEEVIKSKDMQVDLVLDTIGGDTQDRSYGVLKKGGMLVSIVQPPNPAKLTEFGVQGRIFLVHPDGKQLTELAGLIDAGKVTPHVSQTLPLEDAPKAHEQSQTGKTVGKIVLRVK